jgi:sulfatase modifying factor 1
MRSRRSFIGTVASGVLGIGAASPGNTPAPPGSHQPAPFIGRHPGEERMVDGVRLCWCPPGRFRMGSPASEAGRRADEAQVDVVLSRGFWIGKFEVTQGEWKRVMGSLPERGPGAEFGLGDEVPIYWINFPAAETFCRTLSARARRSNALGDDWEYRLPTEAQWEYACRAGTTTATAFGEQLTVRQANIKAPEGAAGRAVKVGSYPPNPWGIHDMHGNIFEWCRDWYHAQLPGGTDPEMTTRGVPNGDGSYSRVRRGGAWNDAAVYCRSAMRLRYEPERRSDHIGFRVALVPQR